MHRHNQTDTHKVLSRQTTTEQVIGIELAGQWWTVSHRRLTDHTDHPLTSGLIIGRRKLMIHFLWPPPDLIIE